MARLQNITIGGYKSISYQEPLSIDLGRVNVIIGANGSGKSNIISFFKMLNYMMSESFQSYVETNGGSQVFLHYGSKITQNIKGSLVFHDKRARDEYNFVLSYASPDNLIITSEETSYQSSPDKQPSIKKLEVNYRESVIAQESENKTLKVLKKILSNCKVYQFHDSSMTAAMRNSCFADVDNYLQAEANNLPAFLYRLQRDFPKSYETIISYIRMVVPQFYDFILEPNSRNRILLKWKDNTGSDYIFLPSQFSDGSMRFIALAALLLQPRQTMPKMIIIDEPELGLHPYAISQLAEMIKEASNNAQIIIATQSPLLIDEFESNQIIVVESEREDGINHTIARRLNQEELSSWLEEYSISELWEKNVIGGRPV